MNLYLHIPFCRQACHYCNFHFSTSLRFKEEMLSSIHKELRMRRDYISNEDVETVYFGGGTPSLLEPQEITSILQTIRKEFSVCEDAEITLEANPDDINEELLQHWVRSGINRLSIGIQSFHDHELKMMNRVHNASQSRRSLSLALKYFNNITADLIYGMPGSSDDDWRQNVQEVIDSGVPHLSCYALTVEPNTPLHKLIRSGRIPAPDTDVQARQFTELINWLDSAGFEHYEISNFAKPGFRSRHNSSYWSVGPDGKGKHYLGAGPSAHSFDGTSRQWNVSNNAEYIRKIGLGLIPAEREVLNHDEKLNEFIMVSLRKKEGLDLSALEETEKARLLRTSRNYEEKGMLRITGTTITLTSAGKLFADRIAADLFK